VLDAWLEVSSNGSTSVPYPIYFLSRSWGASSVTWSRAKNKQFWSVPGAKGAQDRSTVQFATVGLVNGPNTIHAVDDAAVLQVQGWVNDPKNNLGLIIVNETTFNSLQIRTSSSEVADQRPGLGIRYCP
jgi:hypothetical protein